MIRFLRTLWKDRRGNAIIIAGAALPIVVGGAGLATDTIQWVLWKRELQRAADSAAMAAVYAEAENSVNTSAESVSSSVTADLAKNNNHTGNSLLTGYPQIAYPANTGVATNSVQVTLAIQKTLGFSSLFLKTAPTITASATAAMVPGLNPCAIGLAQNTASVIIGGSSTTNLGCPVMANSTLCPAVTTNGSSYSFTAPKVAAAGCLPSSITGVTTLLPHYLQQKDPFAGKYSTAVPSGMTCKNTSQMNYTTTTGTGQNKVTYNHLKAGCYSGNFKITGGTYYLDPGVYYIDSGDFDTTGGTNLIGTQSPDLGTNKNGVTFVLTGTSPGSIKMNGSSDLQLYAPTSSNCGSNTEGGVSVNSCNYTDMLFIQSSSASLNNSNIVQGDNSSVFDGAFYLPDGQVTFSGSSSASTKCAMVIGYTLQFSGNTALQNNTTGCYANTTATIQVVKLIG